MSWLHLNSKTKGISWAVRMSNSSVVRIVSQTTTEKCMKVFTEALHVLFNELLHSMQFISSHHISVSFTILCLCTKLICWIGTTLESLLKLSGVFDMQITVFITAHNDIAWNLSSGVYFLHELPTDVVSVNQGQLRQVIPWTILMIMP